MTRKRYGRDAVALGKGKSDRQKPPESVDEELEDEDAKESETAGPASARKERHRGMSITPLTLTGVSKYSSDLQSILNRAVQIAAIPITQLQNKDSDLIQRKTLLGALNTDTVSLAASLTALGTLAVNQAAGATSSNTSAVAIVGTNGATPTTYTINSITSIAVAGSERSLNPYADSSSTPVSASGNLRLTVGSASYDFPLTTNTLVGLRDKINSLSAGVTASILTTAGGNYLSVAATATGNAPIGLVDDPGGANTALLTSSNPGSDAEFQLNGIDVKQNGNVVNAVIPGVTFQLLAQSNSATTITVATDPARLSSALQTFVSNYNTLRTDLSAQVGPSAGLLSGNTIVTQLQNTLRRLASFTTPTGTVRSLADLGVTFDNTGKASFSTATFNGLSSTNVTDALGFIGSATSNLAGFSRDLAQFSDPIEGMISLELNGIDQTDQHIQSQISTLTDRVSAMQASLSQRLATADSLLASLESQQQTLTANLQGLNLVLYGKYTGQ